MRKLAQLFAVSVFVCLIAFCPSPASADNGPVASAPSQVSVSKPAWHDRGQVGVGIKFSSLGPGFEVATSLASKLNLRGGFNFFQYSRNFDQDGVNYSGQLNLKSAELHLDWYPFGHGFHLSPGALIYNGNGITATAAVPGNSTFTLGGTEYLSDPNQPITGNGKLDFRKAAPSILFGFGNLVPHTRHFAINFEAGVVFAGAARTALNLAGDACDTNGTNCVNAATDPNVQNSVQSEEARINHKLNPFKYYPVISLGLGYRF